jgi:Ni,Fe-hydrogenase I small subunit
MNHHLLTHCCYYLSVYDFNFLWYESIVMKRSQWFVICVNASKSMYQSYKLLWVLSNMLRHFYFMLMTLNHCHCYCCTQSFLHSMLWLSTHIIANSVSSLLMRSFVQQFSLEQLCVMCLTFYSCSSSLSLLIFWILIQ